MPEIANIILFTAGAGSCMLLGGLFSGVTRLLPRWLENEFRHFIIALGGGILLGAVAVVLVPRGMESMNHSILVIPALLAGGLLFFGLERWLDLNRHAYPQLLGMLLDYIPEAIALGGMMALDARLAPLLAVLMGMQNLPEGFNACRELEDNGQPRNRTLGVMAALVLLGPAAGLAGYFMLGDRPWALGLIMVMASGGILYLLFQDIAPQSKLERHWAPPLGAVFGFCISLFSEMLVSGAG